MRYVSHLFCLFYLITRSRCTHIHMEWHQFECTPAMAVFDQTSPVLVCECNFPRPDWSGHGTTRVNLIIPLRTRVRWIRKHMFSNWMENEWKGTNHEENTYHIKKAYMHPVRSSNQIIPFGISEIPSQQRNICSPAWKTSVPILRRLDSARVPANHLHPQQRRRLSMNIDER